ncbi:MAG TPA: hypothetical protein EYQ24_01815 [Bacteroidetes bacterium]|nr:hypothetical protein [Bacteroidota bacterium]
MQYLLSEIVVFLILAWIVGLLTGWLIWRSSGSTETDETLKRKLADSQSMVRNLQRKVDTLQSEPTHHAALPDRLAATPAVPEQPAADDEAPTEAPNGGPRLSSLPGGPTAAAFLDDLVADETEPPAPPAPAPLPDAPPMDEAPTYDDLQRITGIGPDFAQQLADLGVTTSRGSRTRTSSGSGTTWTSSRTACAARSGCSRRPCSTARPTARTRSPVRLAAAASGARRAGE